jgi:hypothetical protein
MLLKVQKERELAAMHRKTRNTDAMTMGTQPHAQPLASSSTTVAQSRHITEIPDRISERPKSGGTSWEKLKEQASRDRSKKREVLIAVNSDPASLFSCF